MKPETPPTQKEHPIEELEQSFTPQQLDALKSAVRQPKPRHQKRKIGAQSADLANISETEQDLDVNARTGQTGSKIVPEEDNRTNLDILRRY